MKNDVANEGTYKVKVVNPDGTSSEEKDFRIAVETISENSVIDRAVIWAKKQAGSKKYEIDSMTYCFAFVKDAYIGNTEASLSKKFDLFYQAATDQSAKTAYNYLNTNGKIHQGIPAKGAWVFYDVSVPSVSRYGHVALAIDDVGTVMHVYPGGIRTDQYELTNLIVFTYLGWAYPPLASPLPNTPSYTQKVNPDDVSFSWDNLDWANIGEQPDYYELYVSEQPYGESNIIFHSGEYGDGKITTTSFKYPSDVSESQKLKTGTLYRWNVRAHYPTFEWDKPAAKSYFTTGDDIGNEIPVADFTISPDFLKTFEEYQLDASGSTNGGNIPLTGYIWTIDDKKYTSISDPEFKSKFEEGGIHKISLVVRDAAGRQSDSTEKLIDVEESTNDGLTVTLHGPIRMSNGESRLFRIDIFNSKNLPSGPLFVVLDLPEGLSLTSSTPDTYTCINDNRKVSWIIDEIHSTDNFDIFFYATYSVNQQKQTGPLETKVTVRRLNQMNAFFPGIGWEPASKDNGKSYQNRAFQATSFNAILVKDYFETNDRSQLPSGTLRGISALIDLFRDEFDLRGATHVWLAYRDIATPENYIDNPIANGRYNVIFSHSGGTQTLYKKMERGDVTAKYVFFIAPALLDQAKLEKLVEDKKVEHIFIVQSDNDILYKTQITFEKNHVFDHWPFPNTIAPAIYAIYDKDDLAIRTPYWMSAVGLIPSDLSDEKRSKIPDYDSYWIGGSDRLQQKEFLNSSEITVLNPTISGNPIEVHSGLLDWVINQYLFGGEDPFDGSIHELRLSPLPQPQIASWIICRSSAHDPNEKIGPINHYPSNQALIYNVEYENEGDGSAFGVYITDVLDPSLDDATLDISPVFSTATGQQIAGSGIYYSDNRTIRWDIGEVGPGEGGYSNISVKFNSSVPEGTVVTNYATVYFPSAFEETQTNVIVTIKGVNLPPEVPNLTYPVNNDNDQLVNGTLFWQCHDHNNETLVYDVYLGTTSSPPLVLENTTLDRYFYSGLVNDATYYWKIIAKDPYDGVTSSEILQFTIISNTLPPIAHFTFNATVGQVPLSIQYIDNSTGNITSRLWSFGDDTTAENVTEVTHTYTQSGNYTVTLTVSGPDGEDTSSQRIEVLPPQCTLFGNATIFGNPAPVGSLVSASAAGFNQSVVIEQEGWYGEAEMGQGIVLQGDIPTGSPITFMVNGSPAWFGLPDEYGNTTWLGTSFPFFPNSVFQMNLDVPTTLIADFSATQTTGALPFDVIFTDLSEGDPFIRIWDFGDGSNETTVLNSTHHVYANPGVYPVHLTVKRGAAQSELMKNDYITVTNPPPLANFTANITIGQLPLAIQFTDNSTGENITSHLWSFGDGGTSTETNPVHVYTTPGLYTVTLEITNDGGSDTHTKTNFIRVFDATPIADFIAEPQSGDAPLSVQFYDTSIGLPNGWQWTFGDGTTTTTHQSPSHTYTSPGNYTVSLTAGSSGGTNTTVKAGFIRVSSGSPTEVPVANFTADIWISRFSGGADFYDTSTGNPDSWNWSFGDGSYSEERNPWHYYQGIGSYPVSLTVSNSEGSDTISRDDFIVIPTPAPEADFFVAPRDRYGSFPLTVLFQDQSEGSIDWDTPPATYEWDFGDGSPNSTERGSVYHNYMAAGTYTVTLTVTDIGGSDTLMMVNYIGQAPPPQPIADFTATPKYGYAPLTVDFIDQSTGSPLLTYTWDLGDGNTSYEKNPSHTYETPGLYSVTLVTTNMGGSSTIAKEGYIEVLPAPLGIYAEFSATPKSGTSPLTVDFIDQSGSGITSWAWSFGDGGSSTEKNPTHIFPEPGTYTVSLTVTGAESSSIEEKVAYIQVNEVTALQADFTSNVTTGTMPVTVQFLDASTGDPSAWSWVFEKDSDYPVGEVAAGRPVPVFGNEFSHEKNSVVTYTYPGNYSVSLTVSRTGETDTITKDEYIRISPPAPVVDFNAYPLEGNAPLEVEFWENVPYAWYYDEFLWDFGDGTSGSGTWLYHTYNTPGLYSVTLTVNSAYGSNSTTKTHFINATLSPPVPGFEGSPLSGNAPLDVMFTDTSAGMVTSRLWDFGDGTTEWVNATSTVSHSYPFPGNYAVSLTVGNDAGEQSLTKTAYIQVNPSGTPPHAWFTVSPMMGYGPLTVRFTDRSSGMPLKWQWDFGDGNTSSERNPSHTYSIAGRYIPTLTVYNTGGSDSSSSFVWVRSKFIIPTFNPSPTVTVKPPLPSIPGGSPISFFAVNKSFGSAPMTVQFTDRSFNNPMSWQWDFGDGHTSTVRNPINTFTESGTYLVRLTVKNSIGESTTSRRVYVR